MATPMTAGQFLGLLQQWKVPYKEVPGWPTRNRTNPAEGHNWGPVHGVLLHHTGDDAPDTADTKVLTQGRPDLPGPLCHWGMDDDGHAVLIGWGRANHAGRGAANVLDALLADRPVPRPGPDSVDGNARLYGQETMYSGRKRMTPAAYLSTVTIFAAICTWHGWSAESCIGHKEWTSRKIDPGSLNMDDFRADVALAIKAGPPRPEQAKSDETTGDNTVGDREVLEYGGKTYERRGFFLRYISTPEELHRLIDPAPKGLGVPKRAGSVADFIGLVDIDKLEIKLDDARQDAASALAGLTALLLADPARAAVVHAPTDQVPDPVRDRLDS